MIVYHKQPEQSGCLRCHVTACSMILLCHDEFMSDVPQTIDFHATCIEELNWFHIDL